MISLAAVFSHPIQHFAPLFRDIARAGRVRLRVFYCTDWGSSAYRDPGFGEEFAWDIPLLEGYDHEFLPQRRRPERMGFLTVDNPAVGERLERFGADAVWVHGYSYRTNLRALRWARRHGRKALLSGDSELLHRRTAAARAVKRLVLPPLFRRVDVFLGAGDENERYYRHYGVAQGKIVRCPIPVDLARFAAAEERLGAAGRGALRRRLGLDPGAFVALFVGKFVGIKRPHDLVEALARVGETARPVQALFVGAGPLRAGLERRAAELGVADRVRFTGFVNQLSIPGVLCAGDAVAVTSEQDAHPLAVSEAIAVGNVAVVSDRVGCVGPTDTARPEVNALVYPCGDAAALAERLRRLALDRELCARMSSASRAIARTQDTRVAAAAVAAAAELAVLGAAARTPGDGATRG